MARNGTFLLVSLSLAALPPICGCANRPSPDEADAIATIERLGGQVKRDSQGAVAEVALGGTRVSAAELARLPVFKSLKTLSLFDSSIGDDDLKPLTDLPQLETLYLGRTRVGDAGLAHLANITGLKTLGLSDTSISDRGIRQLASLANLRSVNVHHTQVTVTGGNDLRAALPNLVVHY